MRPLDLTATGIIRALSAIDEAVRGKADALAAQLSRRGIEARVEAQSDAACLVIASGETLFAREFGGLNRPAETPIGDSIERLRTGDTE